jgi:hypothetical protein
MSKNPKHTAARARRGIGVRILLFGAGFVLAGGAAALAFYVIHVIYSSNDAFAQATQLAPPTSPTASADDTSGTITVGWTPATQPTGVVVQYQVIRTDGPGSPATVCTVASSVTSCQDTGLIAGTPYDYSITAILDNWQTTPIKASATTASPTLSIALSTNSTTAGTPITVQTITAMVGGVTDPTYAGAKTITWSGLANSPSGGAASYPSSSITFTNGVATLTGPGSTFTDDDAGNDTLAATDTNATSVTGAVPLTIRAAAPISFSVPTPLTQNAGTAFNETVTALDPYGNTATGYTGSESITFTGPSDSPDGSAPIYPASVTFAAGVGTAPITLFDAETATLTATQGFITGTSWTFTVNARGASSLIVSNPSTQSVGTSFNETVSALDPYGNPATGWTSVTRCVTFTGPSDSPDGTAPTYPSSSGCATPDGRLSFSASGQATAPVTLFDAQSTSLSVTSAAPSHITGSSGSFTVNALDVNSFNVPTPSTQNAGTAFNETVTALDPYGNTATSYTGQQSITFTGPSDSPDGTAPIYPASVTFAAGVATAPITLFDAESPTLTATVGSLTGTSWSFMVNAIGASQLGFIAQPSSPESSGSTWVAQPVVAVEDTYGNTVTFSSASIELNIDLDPSGGTATLTCTEDPKDAKNGVAKFAGCEITTTDQGDYTLSGSSGSLDSATSTEIEISAS